MVEAVANDLGTTLATSIHVITLLVANTRSDSPKNPKSSCGSHMEASQVSPPIASSARRSDIIAKAIVSKP